jgi:NAD(P)-dependent dehydrogenase (short-subunit alcohol dehydrogenase family)
MLEGKSAIVTGSSRGIGKAIAVDLAEKGAGVVINCRERTDLAEGVADEIRSAGGKALVVRSDVSTVEGAGRLVDACREEFGGVDVLVNNAGVVLREPITTMAEEQLEDVIRTDLLGCFHTCRFAVREMIEGGAGSIVNVSSIVGMIGMRGATAYAAAKGGLNALTVCLAREVARYGIRVNGVAPGYVETEMIEDWEARHFEKVLPRIPMRRLALPEEVAEVVTFLAGGAGYVTGQTVVVDGGIMID